MLALLSVVTRLTSCCQACKRSIAVLNARHLVTRYMTQLRVPEDSDSVAHLVKNMRKRTDPERHRRLRESFSLRPAPALKELRAKLEKAKGSLAEVKLSSI